MTAEAAHRVTAKHPSGALVTIGGDTFAEFAGSVQAALGDDSDSFLEAYADTLKGLIVDKPSMQQAVSNVTAQIPARTVEPPRYTPPVEPWDLPGQERPMCRHGARVRYEGTAKSGKNIGSPYVAWFCPTEKDAADKCKPVYE